MSDDLEGLARDYGVSTEAVRVLRDAVRRGGGRQAQFSHPEFGGMGQWSEGGMTQLGVMDNVALKARVGALCAKLAAGAKGAPSGLSRTVPRTDQQWWPDGLGQPSATGSQNGMRYAYFPQARRVAVELGGVATLYNSQDHAITGVAQQQSAAQDLVFSSQKGSVRASDLPVAA